MDYFIAALKKYADFTGRASRKEYWMYVLFYFIFYIVLLIIDKIIDMPIFSSIFAIGLLIPSLSIAARRLHDTSKSGWWQLIALIPILGGIVLLIFLVQDSHEANEYGLSPKFS